MVTCNNCFHCCVCPIADGVEYADEQHIRDDCEYFVDTADVVPKSEVDNLKVLLEMTEKAHEGLRELYRTDTDALVEAMRKTEVEVAREIFEELARKSTYVFPTMLYTIAKRDVDELKNKYTEEPE